MPGWASRPLSELRASDWGPVQVMQPPTSAPGDPSGDGLFAPMLADPAPFSGPGQALGPLMPTVQPPIRVTETFPARAIWAQGAGYVVDFGQNMNGRVTMTLPPGQVSKQHGKAKGLGGKSGRKGKRKGKKKEEQG